MLTDGACGLPLFHLSVIACPTVGILAAQADIADINEVRVRTRTDRDDFATPAKNDDFRTLKLKVTSLEVTVKMLRQHDIFGRALCIHHWCVNRSGLQTWQKLEGEDLLDCLAHILHKQPKSLMLLVLGELSLAICTAGEIAISMCWYSIV